MRIVVGILFFIVTVLLQAEAYPYTLFKENGKVGLKNDQGKVVIPARYESIGWSNGKFSVVSNVTGCQSGDMWGLINLSNERITKVEFEELFPVGENLVIARKRTSTSMRPLTGGITPSGKEVIPFSYDGITVESFRAIVFTKIGNQFRYGLIDLTNKTIIPQQYQDIRSIGTLRYAVRNFEGKQALFSETGIQMTAFSIDSISVFKASHAVVYEGRYQGLINRSGEFRLQAKYREIVIDDDGKIMAREPDTWIILSGNNDVVKEVAADSIDVIEKGLYKVSTSGQVQLTDDNFKPVMRGAVSRIDRFSNNRARYLLKNLAGVIQKDGTVIVPALYRQIEQGRGFILANSGYGEKNAWILFDSLGVRKTTRTYEKITPYADGLFLAQNKSFCGLIDFSGKEKVRVIYDSILQIKGEHLVVKFQGLYGVIDLDERWIVTPRQNRIELLGNDRFLEFTPSSVNLKSLNGGLIYFTANRVEPYADYLAEYLSSGNVWKIDFNGVIVDRQLVPSEPVEMIWAETEGYRAIKRKGRFGFVDSKGRLRIANRYEAVQPFNEGLAAVKILGKWGFINTHDNITVQPVYEEVWPFQKARALVRQKGLFGLIDPQGKLVLPVRYETIETLKTGNLLIQINNQVGLSDPTGRILVTPRYESLRDTGSGFVIVSRGNQYGVVSYQGVSTIPIMYEVINYDKYSNQFLALRKSQWINIAP